jgi:hypothetical protein
MPKRFKKRVIPSLSTTASSLQAHDLNPGEETYDDNDGVVEEDDEMAMFAGSGSSSSNSASTPAFASEIYANASAAASAALATAVQLQRQQLEHHQRFGSSQPILPIPQLPSSSSFLSSSASGRHNSANFISSEEDFDQDDDILDEFELLGHQNQSTPII